jgi:NitT/TauT family transport system substrate-binding protein
MRIFKGLKPIVAINFFAELRMKTLAHLACTLVCCVMVAAAPLGAAEAPGKILLAHAMISNMVAPVWIAKERGFYRKYGLDVDPIYIIGGRAVQAMMAGQVPVGMVGPAHVVNVATMGGDLVTVLGLQDTLNYMFVARPSIKRAEDLKDKKVAIATPSGTPTLATYLALDYFGLDPKRDNIVLLQVGGLPERLAALRSGVVEATALFPEYAQLATSEGYRVLLDMRKENIPFPLVGLVASRALMKSSPQTVENLVKAILEGAAFVRKPDNKDAVMRTLARNLRLEKPDRLEKAYQGLLEQLAKSPCPSRKGFASVLKIMVQYDINVKAAKLTPEQITDLSICHKLEENGFVRGLD